MVHPRPAAGPSGGMRRPHPVLAGGERFRASGPRGAELDRTHAYELGWHEGRRRDREEDGPGTKLRRPRRTASSTSSNLLPARARAAFPRCSRYLLSSRVGWIQLMARCCPCGKTALPGAAPASDPRVPVTANSLGGTRQRVRFYVPPPASTPRRDYMGACHLGPAARRCVLRVLTRNAR